MNDDLRNPKISIVNAYGRSNRGDAVLLDECLNEIRAIFPKASISCALFEGSQKVTESAQGITYTERIGNSTTSFRLGKIFGFFNCLVALASLILRFHLFSKLLPKRQLATYTSIIQSDIVVSAPGGYIHDTNHAFYIALLHIYLGVLANKRVILAPQSIGPIESRIGRITAKFVLSKVDMCCVREGYSRDFLLKELALPPKLVTTAGDSAFWDDNVSNDANLLEQSWKRIFLDSTIPKKVMGVTVVDWTFPKAVDSHKLREQYAIAMATAIDHASKHFDLTAVIFNQVNEDLPMARDIASRCESKVFVDTASHDSSVLRALISKSTIFLGTRFHSCIFAMNSGIPTIAISYLPKTSNILIDLGLDHKATPIDTVDGPAIISMLEKEMDNISNARHAVQEAVLKYRNTMPRFRIHLSNLATRQPT